MERERLTRLLEDPSRTTREDVAGLRAMAERYPWFTGAQLLRAAGERAQGNVLADETLRTAAAHLPSRAALHDLVERDAAAAPLRVVKTVPAARPEALPVSAPVRVPEEPLPIEASRREATEPAAPVARMAPAVTTEEKQVDEARAPVLLPPEEEVYPGPMDLEDELVAAPAPVPEVGATPVEEAPAEDDALDRQITQAALASAFDLTLLEALPEVLPATPEKAALPSVPKAESADRALISGRLRFTEWLDATSDSVPASPTPVPSGWTTEPSTAQRTTAPVLPETAAVQSFAKKIEPGAANDLIDRFIRQQPPEIPPKPAFFTPQQAAKKSLDDSVGLVTETLARIYEGQGNIAKAIEAYGRLALKYPEKSSYFAALQKKLEDQLNA